MIELCIEIFRCAHKLNLILFESSYIIFPPHPGSAASHFIFWFCAILLRFASFAFGCRSAAHFRRILCGIVASFTILLTLESPGLRAAREMGSDCARHILLLCGYCERGADNTNTHTPISRSLFLLCGVCFIGCGHSCSFAPI